MHTREHPCLLKSLIELCFRFRVPTSNYFQLKLSCANFCDLLFRQTVMTTPSFSFKLKLPAAKVMIHALLFNANIDAVKMSAHPKKSESSSRIELFRTDSRRSGWPRKLRVKATPLGSSLTASVLIKVTLLPWMLSTLSNFSSRLATTNGPTHSNR
jgi:hypothetical protein